MRYSLMLKQGWKQGDAGAVSFSLQGRSVFQERRLVQLHLSSCVGLTTWFSCGELGCLSPPSRFDLLEKKGAIYRQQRCRTWLQTDIREKGNRRCFEDAMGWVSTKRPITVEDGWDVMTHSSWSCTERPPLSLRRSPATLSHLAFYKLV